jgi:hypothetical protein
LTIPPPQPHAARGVAVVTTLILASEYLETRDLSEFDIV